METKNCQNCKKNFNIDPEDFSFYEKMKVPAPTWCPECRMIRRFSFTNIWNLYKRNCDKCGKSTISIYSADKKMTVYCQPCWWGDSWDGTDYEMEYDSSRPFLSQVKELVEKTPYSCLESAYLTLVNSPYTNATAYSKNCYMTFWSDYSENVFYSTFLYNLKDSLDCYRMKECELCYEVVGGHKCYKTFYSEECDSCSDVWFSRSCAGCTNCFGCINLRNKSYCIFNEQYNRESYFEKLKEFNLDTYSGIEKMKNVVHDFWMKYPRRLYIGNSLNVNVTGDCVYESKNAKDAYMVSGAEDCRYLQFISVASAKDCYDYSGWGNGAEKIYECSVVGEGSSDVRFSDECWPDAMDVEYSVYTIAGKHCFGCVNLKRKKYCILNKQYSKEEYEKLTAQIRDDMVKNPYTDELGRQWKYGEFLPVNFSPFAYNESVSHAFFPKSSEQAKKEGYNWYEGEVNQYPITIQPKDIPGKILETEDSILKEIIECELCKKAFRIVDNELGLMRKLGLPLPHQCQNCRQKNRFAKTNSPVLYDRKCDKCKADIQTSYSPDRSEIVYCESCYQQEII